MDELFFAADEHQALAEPMVSHCACSAPVKAGRAPQRRVAVKRYSVVQVVTLALCRWLTPLRTAPPAWA